MPRLAGSNAVAMESAKNASRRFPVERLRAVPFAAYCIDCQTKRNERRRPGEGDVDEPSRHVWTPPGELKESVDE